MADGQHADATFEEEVPASGSEDIEVKTNVQTLLQDLIDKVARQDIEDNLELDQAVEAEDVQEIVGIHVQEAAEPKEIRDFNNNIIFPVNEEDEFGVQDHALFDSGLATGAAEFGIGDYLGAGAAASDSPYLHEDSDKEEMKDMVHDIQQGLLLLKSELSCTESTEQCEDAQDEIFEDMQEAEQELFNFREALAKADTDVIESCIEVRSIIILEDQEQELEPQGSGNVDFLYPPPSEDPELADNGSSTDEDEEETAAPEDELKTADDSTAPPFMLWARERQKNYQNPQEPLDLNLAKSKYVKMRSKSNACCGQSKQLKRIRFASQTQIIPSSSKYISDEDQDEATIQALNLSCAKDGSIRGEGLPLRNKAGVDELASPDNEEEITRDHVEQFVHEELFPQASELSVKIDNALDDIFLPTVDSYAVQQDLDEESEQVQEADECSYTESIECIPDDDVEEEYPKITIEEIEAESTDDEMKSPIQKLSNKSFLNLYMTESQKSCGEAASAVEIATDMDVGATNANMSNENQNDEFTQDMTGADEARLDRLDIVDMLFDRIGEVIDEATLFLQSAGSTTSIDDEFIHSEEWKEMEQAKEQMGHFLVQDDDSLSAEQSQDEDDTQTDQTDYDVQSDQDPESEVPNEYDHLYSGMSGKVKEMMKPKIESRNKFFDSCKPEKRITKPHTLPVVGSTKKYAPHPFQYNVDGWPQFDFRYEYNYYNNYCVTRTGLESPRISPRGSSRIKMQIQSVLKELRSEENLVRRCSYGPKEGKSPNFFVSQNGTSSDWKDDNMISMYASKTYTNAVESDIEQVFDIAELEAEANASGYSDYEFMIATGGGAPRSPSLVGFPRTPPCLSLAEQDSLSRKEKCTNIAISSLPGHYRIGGKTYPKEMTTDLEAIPTLQDDGDKPPQKTKQSKFNLAEDLQPDTDSDEIPPSPTDHRRTEQPAAARKSSFSFLRRLFGSSSSLRQVAPSTSEVQQRSTKTSRSNLLFPFLNRK